jgi:hypothetical protein
MAMKALSLLPPSAVAPHVQVVLQTLRKIDGETRGIGDDDEIAMRISGTAIEVLSRLELPLPLLVKMLPELLADLEDEFACDGAMLLLGKLPPDMLSKLPPVVLSAHITAVLRAVIYQAMELAGSWTAHLGTDGSVGAGRAHRRV